MKMTKPSKSTKVMVQGTPCNDQGEETGENDAAGEEEPEDWEIENWARTIMDAKEIENDGDKMKYVKPMLEKKAVALQKVIGSVDDLRALSKKMDEKGGK